MIEFVIFVIAISIGLYFLLTPKPIPYPSGKLISVQTTIPLFQMVILDSIDPTIRILSTSSHVPLLFPVNTKVYIQVPLSNSCSLVFVDDNQMLGIVSLVNLNGSLSYFYSGTASSGTFKIETNIPSGTVATPLLTSSLQNTPLLVTQPSMTTGMVPFAVLPTPSQKGYQMPIDAPVFPTELQLMNYNRGSVDIAIYTKNVSIINSPFLPYTTKTVMSNQLSDLILLPTIRPNEYLVFLAYNYTDGSLSACVLRNESGKAFLVPLFGCSASHPDFVLTIPSVSNTPSNVQQINLIKKWSSTS